MNPALNTDTRSLHYYVECYAEDEKRFYCVPCKDLAECLDIADVFICQGDSPSIVRR